MKNLQIDTLIFQEPSSPQYESSNHYGFQYLHPNKNLACISIQNIIQTILIKKICFAWNQLVKKQAPSIYLQKKFKSSDIKSIITPKDVMYRLNSHIHQMHEIDRAFSHSPSTKKKERPLSYSHSGEQLSESRALILKEIVEKLKNKKNSSSVNTPNEQKLDKRINRLQKMMLNIKKQHLMTQNLLISQKNRNSDNDYYRGSEENKSQILFAQLNKLRQQLTEVRKQNNNLWYMSQANSSNKLMINQSIKQQQLELKFKQNRKAISSYPVSDRISFNVNRQFDNQQPQSSHRKYNYYQNQNIKNKTQIMYSHNINQSNYKNNKYLSEQVIELLDQKNFKHNNYIPQAQFIQQISNRNYVQSNNIKPDISKQSVRKPDIKINFINKQKNQSQISRNIINNQNQFLQQKHYRPSSNIYMTQQIINRSTAFNNNQPQKQRQQRQQIITPNFKANPHNSNLNIQHTYRPLQHQLPCTNKLNFVMQRYPHKN